VTIERNRYFPGRLLSETDLTQEQVYLLEKARRHNRMLHGWGVVCGLSVRPDAGGGALIVEPGYALDPRGDEIVVADEVRVDLFSEDGDGNAVSPCPQREDREREPMRRERLPGQPLYLAIRYAECPTRPVPLDESTEYSRTRESVAVKLLTKLPGSYRRRRPPRKPDGDPCPDSLGEPWVILAEIALDEDLKIANVDCHSHERRVAARSAEA
jgi:hypothetical protein